MESRAKLFGHPIHQMLIVFPLGLLATAVVLRPASRSCSATGLLVGDRVSDDRGGRRHRAARRAVRRRSTGWRSRPAPAPSAIGAIHGLGNVIVVLLFAASWLMRREAPAAAGPDRARAVVRRRRPRAGHRLARRRAGRSPLGRRRRWRARRRAQLAADARAPDVRRTCRRARPPRSALRLEGPVAPDRRHARRVRARHAALRLLLPRSAVPRHAARWRSTASALAVRGGRDRSGDARAELRPS